jgi:hypothetical protein
VKKVRTTSCTRFCLVSFTLWHTHVPEREGEGVNPKKKCPAEKIPNRAGAPPLFGLSAAQKVFGVAPALGTVAGASSFFRRGRRVSEVEP